jgi:hypothetical protein
MPRWKAHTLLNDGQAHNSPLAYGTIATILARFFLIPNAYSDQ